MTHSLPSRGSATCLLLALALAACASAPPVGPPLGATLEVVNRTREDLAIDVRGRVELVARPGTRARVRELAPGPALVVARGVTGGPGAFAQRGDLELARGVTTTWVVMPDAAGGEALAEPPPLAGLRVRNETTASVRVDVDGVALGRVFAGESRRFVDLASGPHELAAVPDGGGTALRVTVDLPPEIELPWTVEPQGGALRIHNATTETLEVALDGAALASIGAGATWDGKVALGVHVLTGVSQPSRHPYESTLTIAADAATPATWEVTAGQAAVVVENHTGEALEVRVPGRDPQVVAVGAAATFADVPTGPLTLEATGALTHLVYAGRVDLAPGQIAHWEPEPVMGSIRVVNRTGRKLWIYTKVGRGEETLAGELAGEEPVIVRNLALGPVSLAAVEPIGKRRYATDIDLREVPAASWTVTPAMGSLAVRNDRDEPVTVYVDARRAGEVPAGASRVLPGLAVGIRVVEAVGQRTGYAQHDRATVTEDRVAAVTLPDPSAFVVVENATGEVLATRGSLADQVATLNPGSVTRFRVRAGKVRLSTVGKDSGLAYQTDLDVKSGGDPSRWIVRQTPATLIVWNRLAEAIALTVDGRALGSIAPDQRLEIPELAPGERTVQAVGLKSGTLRTEAVGVSPGATERLTFALHLGSLIVENRAAEPVSVAIDDRPYGDVAAGAIHGFANVAPGKHRVGFTYLRSHRESATDLEVREGQHARVVAEVPLAMVVIENGSHQPVRVSVDGEVLGTVAADGPATLMHLPAGPRLVQLDRLGDRTVVTYRLDFWADAVIHLPVPPRVARLVVVNRLAEARSIHFGERVVGTVEANASTIFDELPSEAAELTARDPSGAVTHVEQRRFDPGETATWVLEPAPTRAAPAPPLPQ